MACGSAEGEEVVGVCSGLVRMVGEDDCSAEEDDGLRSSDEEATTLGDDDDGVVDDVCKGSTSGEAPVAEGVTDEVETGVPVQKIGLLE